MTIDLEARLEAWLQAVPVSPATLADLRRVDLPARARRPWLPRLTRLAAAIVAIAIGVLALSWPARVRPPVAAVPPDPAAFAGDARLLRCVGDGPEPLAAFEMTHASEYRRHLPAMGLSPELDRPDPAFVVIYGAGGSPVGLGAPGAGTGRQPSPSRSTETPGPNVHDVCILVGADPGTAERLVYADVDTTGMRAFVGPSPSSLPSASSVRSCVAHDLRGTSESMGAALGNGGTIVRLQNASSSACVLNGYPNLALLGTSGERIATALTHATEGDYLFPVIAATEVVLAPDDVASFQLGYPTNPSGADTHVPLEVACPPASGLAVGLTGGDEPLVVDVKLAPCEGHLNTSPVHAGADWIGFSEASPGLGQVNLASMAWFDRQHGLFVGGSGGNGDDGTVWRTDDGGTSWQTQTLPGGSLDVVAVSGTSAWAGRTCSFPPCKARLYRSDDSGVTWRQVGVQPVASLAFSDKDHGWGIVAREGALANPGLLETTDGGATWSPTPSPCPPNTGVPVALSFPDPQHGWLACNGTVGAGNATKAILRTNDGQHWHVTASAPWPGEGQVVGSIGTNGYLIGLSMVADGTGMFWADRGVSARTVDGGATWASMNATSFDVVIPASGWAISQRDWLLYVWNGDLGRFTLEESTDGGTTWVEAPGFVAPS